MPTSALSRIDARADVGIGPYDEMISTNPDLSLKSGVYEPIRMWYNTKDNTKQEDNSMAIQEIMSADFEEVVLKSETPVLVDFNATWCGPCRMLKPTLDQVAAERPDVKVVGVDIDENMDLAEEYGVFSIPCLVLFKDGAEAERSVGLVPKDAVLALLDS